MAEAKTGDVPEILSMSLDDIINKNKTKTTSGRKEINGERKGRIGKPSGRREAGGGRGLGGAPGLRVVVQNAGVQKGAGMRSAGGAVSTFRHFCGRDQEVGGKWISAQCCSCACAKQQSSRRSYMHRVMAQS
jgi:hypothetical protein